MKNVKKILAVLLAVLLCGACLVPAFAEDECTHNWQWRISKAPTCGATGLKYQYCTLCGATQNEDTEEPATGEHTLVWVQDQAPTCGAYGKQHQYCTVCEGTFNADTPIQPTGEHTFEWVVDVPASCGKAGYKHEECKVCHAVQSEYTPIQRTGIHTWDWEIIPGKEPTCGTQGEKREYCTVCRENGIDTFRDTALVAATGEHTWDAGVVVREPTCSHSGVMKFECTTCHDQKAVQFEDLPYELRPAEPDDLHVWDAGVVIDAPSCVRPGKVRYTCTECGKTQTQEIAKIAHQDGNGDGQCDRCGSTIGNGENTGVSAKSVYNRMVDFFWGLWQRIVNLFTGKYF